MNQAVNPLSRQISGNHYKDLAIQPVMFAEINELTFCQGNVAKYLTRHRTKNGRADVEKAIHFAELMIEVAQPSWVLLLPLIKPHRLHEYAEKWEIMRQTLLGRSVQERCSVNRPAILPGIYSAVNKLDYLEASAIEAITYHPTLDNVQKGIQRMQELLRECYG